MKGVKRNANCNKISTEHIDTLLVYLFHEKKSSARPEARKERATRVLTKRALFNQVFIKTTEFFRRFTVPAFGVNKNPPAGFRRPQQQFAAFVAQANPFAYPAGHSTDPFKYVRDFFINLHLTYSSRKSGYRLQCFR